MSATALSAPVLFSESESPVFAEPTPIRVPLEVYLNTTYRPDVDWLDGELKERNMCETPHATIQGFILRMLGNQEDTWSIRVLPEQRVQTSASHYRIADVCVVRQETPYEPIIRTAPLLCIEVLSRRDSMSDIQDRMEDYLHMGVPTVWIIDPKRRKAYQSSSNHGLDPVTETLAVPGTELKISIAQMFGKLDWMQQPAE